MQISDLVQPMGGLFNPTKQITPLSDEARVAIHTSNAGDARAVWAHNGYGSPSIRHVPESITGSGTSLKEETARLISLAEGLERYCASLYAPEQFVLSTAAQLGDAAIDLSVIPRCSETELAHPHCPLIAPDAGLPLRWIKSLRLTDCRSVYIPAIMVYLHTGYATPGERIWIPISTGCAAHTSYEKAITSGVLETVERDAISIVWLQKLQLPRIEIDRTSPILQEYWNAYANVSSQMEFLFFDATTDLGIPTIYGVQRSRASTHAHTLVSCSASLDYEEALIKVFRDMAACRVPFRDARSTPANWDNFTTLFHGASYMARVENASAFDFLLKSPERRALTSLTPLSGADAGQDLHILLQRLRSRGMSVYAVDLSTDEAIRVGYRVVRVVVPQLQPFSFYYRARYLGHPRLYQAPRSMGLPVLEEAELNQWPQPFA
jgi:ribosomal protein S12 methylthiotransferase accessory factor